MFQNSKKIIYLFQFLANRKVTSQFSFQDHAFLRSFYLGISINASNESVNQKSPDANLKKPFKENTKDVWVGPPNPASNLRLKVFPHTPNSSDEETHFYAKSKEVQDWNQKYWAAHNKDFTESRKLYIDKVTKEKNLTKEESLSPEEMSVFYKEFLDRNRTKHLSYNWNWYRRNVSLIFLAAKVNFTKCRKLIMNTVKLKS